MPSGDSPMQDSRLSQSGEGWGGHSNGKPPQETPFSTFELTETQMEKNTKLWVNFGLSHPAHYDLPIISKGWAPYLLTSRT